MPTSRRWLQRLIGIGLLAVLLVVILVLRQNRTLSPPTVQEQPVAIVEVAQVQTPDSPLATPIVIGTIYPTETPIPPSTPRPTPTQRPGPTATPYPTHAPASDASGIIFYTAQTDSQRNVEYFVTNEQAQKVGESKPLSIDFGPTLGSASPDGHYLILLKPVFPVGIPYVFDRHTQQIWPLFRDHPMQEHITGRDFGWHPDSRQLLFWFFGNEELWLVDVETGQYTILAFTYGPPQGAAISPDGQIVVYGNRSDGADEAIWKVSSAGGETQRLLDQQVGLYIFGWSPNGKYILYMGGSSKETKVVTGPSDDSKSPLKLIGVDGQNPLSLSGPFLSGWGYEPKWSSDSQWITYTGFEKGSSFGCAQQEPAPDWNKCQFEGTWVYTENISTGEIHKVAPGIKPVWSPNSSTIAFLSNQSGTPEIWTIRVTDNGLQQLTQDGRMKPTFLWIPGEK